MFTALFVRCRVFGTRINNSTGISINSTRIICGFQCIAIIVTFDTKQESCEEVTKYLCKMDYYAYELQGAVLDRTKTLGYGDDECNFRVMSPERAKEIGFVQSPNAR